LEELSDKNYILTYSILEMPLPGKNYMGTMRLYKITQTNECVLDWNSELEVDSQENADTVTNAANDGVYVPGMKALQELFKK
jgi:hypothetical protein